MALRESLSGDVEVNYCGVCDQLIMLFHVSIFNNKESSLVRESQCDGGRVD